MKSFIFLFIDERSKNEDETFEFKLNNGIKIGQDDVWFIREDFQQLNPNNKILYDSISDQELDEQHQEVNKEPSKSNVVSIENSVDTWLKEIMGVNKIEYQFSSESLEINIQVESPDHQRMIPRFRSQKNDLAEK